MGPLKYYGLSHSVYCANGYVGPDHSCSRQSIFSVPSPWGVSMELHSLHSHTPLKAHFNFTENLSWGLTLNLCSLAIKFPSHSAFLSLSLPSFLRWIHYLQQLLSAHTLYQTLCWCVVPFLCLLSVVKRKRLNISKFNGIMNIRSAVQKKKCRIP